MLHLICSESQFKGEGSTREHNVLMTEDAPSVDLHLNELSMFPTSHARGRQAESKLGS